MDNSSKRKAEDGLAGMGKRTKTKKQWRVPHKDSQGATSSSRTIQPGDSGIWVTCNKGKEGKCIGELLDLLREYADILYPTGGADARPEQDDATTPNDIENEIQNEIDSIHKPVDERLFTSIRLDVPCVGFIRTIAPVEPVGLVKRICEDAMGDKSRKRTRFVKRLSPMTRMGRASAEGLEKAAIEVLAPHFHQQPFQKRKFAIRPTLRNHNVLKRDAVIQQVASLVGPGHEVDLKGYELLVVVEIYQNICGVSVLDDSFERLKRYNIAEIYEPTVRDEADVQPVVTQDAAKP